MTLTDLMLGPSAIVPDRILHFRTDPLSPMDSLMLRFQQLAMNAKPLCVQKCRIYMVFHTHRMRACQCSQKASESKTTLPTTCLSSPEP